jgi:fucose permease
VKRIYLAFVLTGVATTMLGPLMPGFELRWGLDDARAGLLFAAQFLASVGLSAAAPALGKWLGYRRAVAIGLALVAAGTAGCMTPSWPLALGAVALYGCGLGVAVTGSNLAIAAVSGGRSARGLLWLNMCWSIGAVAAPALVAKLGPAFLPAVAAGFAALALTVGVRGANPRFAPASPGGEPAGLPHFRFALVLFLYVGVETAVSGWVSTYASRSAAAAGLWAVLPAIFWSAILAGRAASPLALNRLPPRTLAPVGLGLAMLGAGALLSGAGAGAMVAGSILAGFGMAPVFPVVVAEYADLSGGAVSGLVFSAAGLGGAAIPALVGAVSTASGSLRVGLASAVMWIPAILAVHAGLGAAPPGHTAGLRSRL